MVDMVCERADGVCNLCGADPEEDCPLTDLAPELADWSARPPIDPAVACCPVGSCSRHGKCMYVPCRAIPQASSNDECESCQ